MSKIRLRRLLTVQVAVIGVFAIAFAADAAGWTGEMKNLNTDLCMTSGGTKTEGDAVYQWTCNGDANQSWFAEPQDLGGYTLVNEGDNWCLNDRGGAAYDYNLMIMWPCGNVPYNERWYAAGGPDNYFRMAVDASNFYPNGYCVTSGGQTSPGSDVYEYSCSDSWNQFWSGPLVAGPGSSDPSPHGI